MTISSEMVEYASDAAFAIDGRRQIVSWNERAEQLIGYSRREVIGKHCEKILRILSPDGNLLCVAGCDPFKCLRNCLPYGISSCSIQCKGGAWVKVNISSLVVPKQARKQNNENPVSVILLRHKDDNPDRSERQEALQVYTLGCFGLAANGHSLITGNWKRKQALTLMKYLITQLDRPVQRERLIDCMWPEVDEITGWGRLKVTMYYLRQQLRAAIEGEDIIKTVGTSYVLDSSVVWIDAKEFEKLFIDGRHLQQQHKWAEASDRFNKAQLLYRGDYMEEDIYADWCAEERERLREIYLEVLVRMSECQAELGNYAEAVQICRKALVMDPCRESFHRALMKYYIILGHPDRAVAQFNHCKRILLKEYGEEPTPDLISLHKQILKGASGVQFS
jgi:two-component SAPR family response regulator